MPMKPHKGESQSDFMKRCVPEMMGNGKRENDQAVAACMQMFRDDKNKQIDPEDYDTLEEFMADCTAEGEDIESCKLIWEQRKHKGAPAVLHKTHAGAVQGMEFVLSDETPDRMGDVIVSTGWQLDNFKKNPIALFNHRADFPIGKWQNLRIDKGALRGHLQLAPAGTSDRIDEIRKLIEADILRAVSVGFRPVESQARKGAGDVVLGETFAKQELVETSLVSVPANPNALAVAKSMKISAATLDLVFAKQGNRSVVRRTQGVPGEQAETSRIGKSRQMSLAQRIKDAEGRIVGFRDKLTDHLGKVDDSNVSDADLEVTRELNGKIAQEEKGLEALKEAEKRLALTSEDDADGNNGGAEHRVTNGGGNNNLVVARAGSARPFNFTPKKMKAIDYLVRDGVVQLFSHRLHKPIDDVRRAIYGEDEATKAFIEFSQKAATAPAMTNVSGWAQELVQQVNAEFLEPLKAKAIYPRLAQAGLALTFGRNGKIVIPTRSATPTIAGSFVGEGNPIPVRQGAFTSSTLTPKKMAVITTWTREIDEHSVPAIEGLLRDAIQQDTATAIDSVLLDANPATAIRPPGLLNGVAALTATTGGGFNALVGDLKQLSGALITGTQGHVRNMVWLMNPQQVLSIALTAAPGVGAFPFKEEISRGQLLTNTVIDSGTVPLGTVIVVDAADFVTVGGEAPRFEISDQATLHMEDTAPLAISTPGTPATVAAPVRSLWQTDSMALRLILPLNWTLRRTGVVAWTQSVTW